MYVSTILIVTFQEPELMYFIWTNTVTFYHFACLILTILSLVVLVFLNIS